MDERLQVQLEWESLCRVHPDCRVRPERDGAFLLHGPGRNPYLMNSTAYEILLLLQEQNRVRDVVTAMMQRYPHVATDTLAGDVLGLLFRLVREQYVEIAPIGEARVVG